MPAGMFQFVMTSLTEKWLRLKRGFKNIVTETFCECYTVATQLLRSGAPYSHDYSDIALQS